MALGSWETLQRVLMMLVKVQILNTALSNLFKIELVKIFYNIYQRTTNFTLLTGSCKELMDSS